MNLRELDSGEIMVLSHKIASAADKAFRAYPPIRTGSALRLCEDLIDLRDDIDREIWWRAITR